MAKETQKGSFTGMRRWGLRELNSSYIRGMPQELSLSTATVSQHMEELQKMGAVERVDNEHFKRLKYYKASQTPPVSMAKYVIVILLVAAAIGGYAILSYGATGTSQPQRSNGSAPPSIITTTAPQANASTTPIQPGGAGAIACPMMTYSLNGTITGYHGFSLYYVNSSNGGIPDYVTGSSGTFNVSERVTNVLNNNPAQFTTNRTHYAYLAAVNSPVLSLGIASSLFLSSNSMSMALMSFSVVNLPMNP